MKYAYITGQAYSRKTGKKVGKPRTEKINLKENKLFLKAKTILDIKEAFESFWNKLDALSKEIVFCQKIRVI